MDHISRAIKKCLDAGDAHVGQERNDDDNDAVENTRESTLLVLLGRR